MSSKNTKPLTNDEIAAQLRAIAAGTTEVTREGDRVDYGVTELKTNDGWLLAAFFQHGEFDYLDTVVAPDGRRAGFDDMYPEDDDGFDVAEQKSVPPHVHDVGETNFAPREGELVYLGPDEDIDDDTHGKLIAALNAAATAE